MPSGPSSVGTGQAVGILKTVIGATTELLLSFFGAHGCVVLRLALRGQSRASGLMGSGERRPKAQHLLVEWERRSADSFRWMSSCDPYRLPRHYSVGASVLLKNLMPQQRRRI